MGYKKSESIKAMVSINEQNSGISRLFSQTICRSHSSQIIFFTILLISIISYHITTASNYERLNCEYHSSNSSVEWAYEPITGHIVFVLKMKLHVSDVEMTRNGQDIWSGIGFSAANDNKIRQFNAIRTSHGKNFDILKIENNGDKLDIDEATSSNIHTIAVDYDQESEMLIAKFSIPSKNDESTFELKLDGCLSTYITTMPIISTDISSKLQRLVKKFNVCDIGKHCTVDVRQLQAKKSSEEKHTEKWGKLDAKKMKDTGFDNGNVELAHSVDISGTGDPCGYVGMNYMVNWTYNAKSDCVDFVMRHPAKSGKWWSAVGIGDTMADMDIGVFFLEDGTAKKIIDYFSSGYTVPEKDKQQDWTLHTSNSKIVEEVFGESNQKQKVAVTYFSRRLNTDDTNKDRTMDGCVLFQIAANAARYGGNYALRKHVEWPDLYKACDLKKRCAGNLSDHNQENIAHWTDEKEESATEEQLINAAQNVDDTILNKTLSDTSSNFSQSIEMSSVNDVHANTTAVTKTSTLHFTQSTIPKSDEDDQSELSRNTTEISSPESVLNNNSIIQNKSQKPSLVLTLMGEFTTSETTDVSSTSETVFTVNATENIAFFTSVNDSITSVFLTNENNTIDIKNKTIDDAARVINTTIKKLATTRTALPTSTIETPITASQKIEPITTTSSAASRSLGLNTETITRSSKNKNRKSSLSKCVLSKTDLDICEEYMNNYFDQVKQWAEKHNEQMENQYGKACRLLNAVPHVPTLCCHIFREKCDAYF